MGLSPQEHPIKARNFRIRRRNHWLKQGKTRSSHRARLRNKTNPQLREGNIFLELHPHLSAVILWSYIIYVSTTRNSESLQQAKERVCWDLQALHLTRGVTQRKQSCSRQSRTTKRRTQVLEGGRWSTCWTQCCRDQAIP